jgi:hypothetical protein
LKACHKDGGFSRFTLSVALDPVLRWRGSMIRDWALGIAGMASSWLVAPPGAASAAASVPPATPSVERRRAPLALDAPLIRAAASPGVEERATATAGGLHLGAAGLHMATLLGLGIGWYEWQIG